MTLYILTLNLVTADRDLFSVLMEQIQRMAHDCALEDIDYEISQKTHEGDAEDPGKEGEK